jgi:hypothetical protein
MGLRRSRYIGEPRTHLQHVATAAAINLSRLYDWLIGVAPHSTPQSHFALFMQKHRLSSAVNSATQQSENTTFSIFYQK